MTAEAAYRPPIDEQRDDAAAFARIVQARRSTRGYLPTPVDPAVIDAVLALAARAPSNCNVQPWIVHLVSGATLDRLRAALTGAAAAGQVPDDDFGSIKTYPGHHRDRQVATAQALYGAMGIERHDAEGRRAASLRNFAMFGAPHAALIFVPDWARPREIADCGIYAQTLMLALTAHGIGSCPQAALGLYPGVTRATLGVPDEHKLLFGISFGYPDPQVPANRAVVGRVPLDQSVVSHD